jgi:uncharacterized membrane protein YagU involved in acid resistance
METKFKQAIYGGIFATIIMSLFMYLVSFLGLPKMNPPAMLAGMMGIPLFAGWIIHLVIGIIFALAYVMLLFNILKKVGSNIIRGLIFGLIVFIFAQIAFGIMGAIMGEMPAPEGGMVPMLTESLLGHLVYGVCVTPFVKDIS